MSGGSIEHEHLLARKLPVTMRTISHDMCPFISLGLNIEYSTVLVLTNITVTTNLLKNIQFHYISPNAMKQTWAQLFLTHARFFRDFIQHSIYLTFLSWFSELLISKTKPEHNKCWECLIIKRYGKQFIKDLTDSTLDHALRKIFSMPRLTGDRHHPTLDLYDIYFVTFWMIDFKNKSDKKIR